MSRYIDADEFVKRVIQYPRQSTKTIGLALADTPTADVKEAKPGRWLMDSSGAEYCSECLRYPFDDGIHHIVGWISEYCPHCGADMRKKGNAKC